MCWLKKKKKKKKKKYYTDTETFHYNFWNCIANNILHIYLMLQFIIILYQCIKASKICIMKFLSVFCFILVWTDLNPCKVVTLLPWRSTN